MKLERMFAAIRRRIALQIGRFVLAAIDDSGEDTKGRATGQRVDGQVFAGERELQNCAHFQPYGLSAHPHRGAEGLAYAIAGSRSHIVVASVDDPRHRPTDLAEGEVALYTDERLAILLKRGDEIELRGDSFDGSFDDTVSLISYLGNAGIGSVEGEASLVSWLAAIIVRSVAADVQITAGTAVTITAPAINIIGNVAITGGLTVNGKNVSDTHTHVGSPTAPIGSRSDTGQVT